MFNFYKGKDESFELVFKLNNKITKGLIKNKILKMSDLEHYSMPSSLEEIIPLAEKMTGDAKLITDVIAELLKVESFLKISKKDFAKDYLLGEDFVIVKNTYFTTNPLSNYIIKLKKNLLKYNPDEVLFQKIGYISSSDFDILQQELSKNKAIVDNKKISNLKVESLFIDMLFSAYKKKAESFKLLYKENVVKIQYIVENQLYEEDLIHASIESYMKMIDYLKTFFVNDVVIKEIAGKQLKLTSKIGKTTEQFQNIETLNINIFDLNEKVQDFQDIFYLPINDEKSLAQDLKNPYGLMVLSSKRNRKESLYSLVKNQKNLNPFAKIYFLEKEIEKDFKDVEQFKYNSKDDWRELDIDSYSIIFIDEVNSKEDCNFVYSLIAKGKKVFVGVDAPSTIEAFSKLYKWSDSREVLVDNLISIIQTEKINKVCKLCSNKIPFLKDENYQSFQMIENAPKMNSLIRIENTKGCESCYKGFKGVATVAEYLKNDLILKDALLNGFKFDNLKIEKNSASWMNVFENSMHLLENGEVSSNSIILNLGYPRKL